MHVLTQENESCIKTYTYNVPAIFAYKSTNMPHLKTCSNIPEFFGIVCKENTIVLILVYRSRNVDKFML